MNRRLRNAGRKKAPFGSTEAAILGAAAINAVTQLSAAKMNSEATKTSAEKQATAIVNGAKTQSQAITKQNELSRELQTQSQEFIKEENAENRELQKDIQMQLQMLAGQQNTNDRLDAAKIKVKYGGNTNRKKCRQIFLRGGNMPFKVTDGGTVSPIGVTPEGFDLYSIRGNDHEHYHKTNSGKYKSGVGIRFADGGVIEGEGNQNSNRGELMLVTPNNAFFISKHNINGINPVELVEQGVHPLDAYAIQEKEKAISGINDDGSKKAKFGKKRFLVGGMHTLYDIYNMEGPKLGVDTIGDTSFGVGYLTKKERSLKCGGQVRRKADKGTRIGNRTWVWGQGYVDDDTEQPIVPYDFSYNLQDKNLTSTGTLNKQNPTIGNNTGEKFNSSWNSSNTADFIGAGVGALGNLGSALITSRANNYAADTLSNAYGKSSQILADAYNSLRGIDMSSIKKEDYRAAHAMPALQAPISFANNKIGLVNRVLQRRLRNADRNSASSAAAQDRMVRAEIDSQDMRDKIYSADQQQMQEIRQANAERVSKAAEINAKLDTMANNEYASAYLNLLKYNNEIENTKILGAAGALAEGNVNATGAMSSALTSNGQAWSNALTGSTQGFTNTLTSMAKRKSDLNNVMFGASTEAQVRYIGLNGSKREKLLFAQRFQDAIDSGKLSNEDVATYKRYIQWLS